MKTATAPVAGNFLRPGTVVFGPARENTENKQTYSRLFKCRKDGFDFMGQIKINFQLSTLDMEIFNQSYFECFDACKEEVAFILEKKLLSKLLSDKSLSEELKDTIRIILGREGVEKTPKSESKLNTGNKFDLKEIFDRLNIDYFENKIKADVEWGKKVIKKNLTSFRFGSYDPERRLIRIHPRLQQDFVPRSVLELTMYHEMCHQWAPMKRKKGMWVAHHPQFKEKEREYHLYEEACAWEKENWKKLMRPVSDNSGRSKAEMLTKGHEIPSITTLAG